MHTRPILLTLATLCAGLVAACGDSSPSCAQVADHVTTLAQKQRAGGTITAVDRDALLRNCEREQGSNARMRTCVLAATTLAEAKQCELAAAVEQMRRESK